MGYEDRISKPQLAAVNAALKKLENKRRPSRNDENIAYDALVNNGVFADEADELINLTLEQGG